MSQRDACARRSGARRCARRTHQARGIARRGDLRGVAHEDGGDERHHDLAWRLFGAGLVLVLLDVHLLDFAHRAAPGVDFAHAEVSPRPREALDPSYGDALYGIPEIGRAVGPVRTPWGYDVILWTGGLPPKETPRAELEAEMFAEVRRGFFPEWVAQLVKEHGIAIETHPEQLEALEP